MKIGHPFEPMDPTKHRAQRGLCPRNPRWLWQWSSWMVCTLSSPIFLGSGTLLWLNSQCDHPAFWWAMPPIAAIGNAAAILWVNQRHDGTPFMGFADLVRCHLKASVTTGAFLFLLTGHASGFLPDLLNSLIDAEDTVHASLLAAIWSTGLSVAFGVAAFILSGPVHAWLAFSASAKWRCP